MAEEGVTEPINLQTWTLDDLDDTQTTTFVSASITSGVQNGKLTAKVFGYDIYKKEEIENLAVGDKITFHEEGAAQDQCVTTEVKSIERNDQHHLVSINGGMEQPGGLDLKLEDDDTYRTMTFDDYPLYYEMGEKTMPLAEDVVLKDSSADPQAEAVETTGADAVAAAINADPDNWTTYNTTLVEMCIRDRSAAGGQPCRRTVCVHLPLYWRRCYLCELCQWFAGSFHHQRQISGAGRWCCSPQRDDRPVSYTHLEKLPDRAGTRPAVHGYEG